MKNLLILNIENNFDRAVNIFRKLNKENLEILYLNNNVLIKNFNYKLLDDYFKPEYATKIDKFVRFLAKNWYKNFKSRLNYDNILLPELLENEFLKTWPIFLKIEILSRVIKNYDKVYLITEYEEDKHIINEFKNKDFYPCIIKTKFKENNKFKKLFYKFIAKYQNLLLNNYLKRKNNNKNILIIANLRQNISLLMKLRDDNNVIIRAGENLGRGLFTKNCDYYLTFKEFSNRKINYIIKQEKIRLDEEFNYVLSNFNFKYYIKLDKVLEQTLRKIFLYHFLRLIKYIEVTKLLKNIDLILTHNDVIAFEKTVIKEANMLNIPTLTMIEGFLPVKQIKKGTQFIPFTANKMAVHSEAQLKAMINKKIPKDKLFITGYPDFDKYYNSKPIKKELIYKRYNIPLDKKIVLYVGERYTKNKYESSIWAAQTQEQYKEVYRELFRTFKEFPDLFLIIKKHPSGSLDEEVIVDLARKEKFDNYKIISDIDVYGLLNASYAIINRLSTMALEAMFLRKPVIVMDAYFDTNDNFDYTKFDAALHARKKGDLKKLFNKLYDKDVLNKLNKNMEKFVKYNYINDGNASLRMTKLIENLIK